MSTPQETSLSPQPSELRNTSESSSEEVLFNGFLEWTEGLPETERIDTIREFLRDKKYLHIFGRFFFPHIIRGEYETPAAHRDLIRELTSPNESAIIFPRGHAKSTWTKIDLIH